MKILTSKTWRANLVLFALSVGVAQCLCLPAWLGMNCTANESPGTWPIGMVCMVLLAGAIIMSWVRGRARYYFDQAVSDSTVDLVQLRRYGVAGIPEGCPRGWWVQLHLEASGESFDPQQSRNTPHYAWNGWG